MPLSLIDLTGTKTPAATLTFTDMTQPPSLDGGFTYEPPDTHHAVGTGAGTAGRVVHVTNSGVRIFDKTGASVARPLHLDAFLTALAASGLSGIGGAATLVAGSPSCMRGRDDADHHPEWIDRRHHRRRLDLHAVNVGQR